MWHRQTSFVQLPSTNPAYWFPVFITNQSLALFYVGVMSAVWWHGQGVILAAMGQLGPLSMNIYDGAVPLTAHRLDLHTTGDRGLDHGRHRFKAAKTVSLAYCKTVVSPMQWHWRYQSCSKPLMRSFWYEEVDKVNISIGGNLLQSIMPDKDNEMQHLSDLNFCLIHLHFQWKIMVIDHSKYFVISQSPQWYNDTTRQIWGIWKLRLAYSPETPNLGQNRWCFVPCDPEIWWMTLENNRASPLCCFKLCATFHSHRWIETGVTVRKRPIWVKFDEF